MRGRKLLVVATIVALAMALLAGGAVADEAITIDSVDVVDGTATVSGTATFADRSEEQDVGGAATRGFPNEAVAQTAGIELNSGSITELADGSGLRFTWHLEELPAEVPPEGVRYTWAFHIDGRQYQLQAKRTNLASSTTVEDPVNHVQQVQEGDFFQLRGACQAQYLGTPISGCYHLAFLDGGFDVEAGTASIDLPYATRDSIGRLVAPDFVPGAWLDAQETASMSIAASFQAFVSSTTTSKYINGWTSYVAGDVVELGIGRSNRSPSTISYTERAELADDGSFTGTVSGLSGPNDTVFARACSGVVCAYAQVTP